MHALELIAHDSFLWVASLTSMGCIVCVILLFESDVPEVEAFVQDDLNAACLPVLRFNVRVAVIGSW
jgi:hypothetical protein